VLTVSGKLQHGWVAGIKRDLLHGDLFNIPGLYSHALTAAYGLARTAFTSPTAYIDCHCVLEKQTTE